MYDTWFSRRRIALFFCSASAELLMAGYRPAHKTNEALASLPAACRASHKASLTCVVGWTAVLVASKVQLVDIHKHVSEELRLPVENELVQVAAIVHADGLGQLRESRVQDVKDCPACQAAVSSSMIYSCACTCGQLKHTWGTRPGP